MSPKAHHDAKRAEKLIASLRKRRPSKLEPERQFFTELTTAFPGYLSTKFAKETRYEELMCVGYHPQRQRLEAVVYVKQDTGYSGDVCTDGSPEYVRFFVDWKNDGTWTDEGLASFRAHDIPGDKPLEYAVGLRIDPREKWCLFENLPNVRAILSWNQVPTPGDENFDPTWGNVVESQIQIDAFKIFLLRDVFELTEIDITPQLEVAFDLDTQIEAKTAKPLSLGELTELYQKTDVPPHRFAFPQLTKALTLPGGVGPGLIPDPEGPLPPFPDPIPDPDGLPIPGIELPPFIIDKLPEIVITLGETGGDTSYEELTCIGLEPGADNLIGTVQVKLSNGYSGGLCTAGSTEYVAFWVDYDDGAGWTYAGTTSVRVHDLGGIPPDGLTYSVALPVDLDPHRVPCDEGPTLVKVRAILSWQTPPPPGNPNWVPTWGNREETLVEIAPGDTVPEHDHRGFLESVGLMHVCTIDQATGLADGQSTTGVFVTDAPFGGRIQLTGWINNPPNRFVVPPSQWFRYRIRVRQLPLGTWETIDNDFNVWVTSQNGPLSTPTASHVLQSSDAFGYYPYLEHVNGSQYHRVTGDVLAQWLSQPRTGHWEIALDVKLPDGTVHPAGTIVCPDGSTRSNVRVRLDQQPTSALVSITGFSITENGPINPAADCGFFTPGLWIHGTYEAVDADGHFRRLSLAVDPATPANGATVDPSARSYPTVSTNGEAGTWKLDTDGMDPCGYVIRLHTWDRTIANNSPNGWHNTASVGFCLEQPQS